MNTNSQKKLEELLKKRIQKLESVNNFYEYFEKFAFLNLRNVVKTIDSKLEMTTNESLRIFSEHPYENVNSRYFVMVQLFGNSHRRNGFLLDNTENFPQIKFEGDEFNGNIKATILFGKKINKSKVYSISSLNSEEKVFDIMLNFLEEIYNL
ncbi:hypothetical protein [Marinifilum flexuosum]|uniref:hypothetical protein n=1 Tax=Marinifilum flexuosum TaxID=1117708 RepID=UPI00249297CD|nr:hypothetical protein [Marinifilum flexuosum]